MNAPQRDRTAERGFDAVVNCRGSGYRELLSNDRADERGVGRAPLRKSAGANTGNECRHYGVGSGNVMGGRERAAFYGTVGSETCVTGPLNSVKVVRRHQGRNVEPHVNHNVVWRRRRLAPSPRPCPQRQAAPGFYHVLPWSVGRFARPRKRVGAWPRSSRARGASTTVERGVWRGTSERERAP